jgi:site-specific DNA recombinase
VGTAIYARISDDRHDGAGVDRQLEDCRALVSSRALGPAIEFVDNSVSAYSGKRRPRYLEMLAGLQSGSIDSVVVWHVDRLYRQPRELEDIVDLADAGRVQVLTVRNGDLNLDTDAGITQARVAVAFANQESRDKSKRVKRAKQQARDQGRGSGGPRPFGWKAIPKLDSKTGAPVVKNGKPLMTWSREQLEPREVAIIQKAVADLLGGASLNDIARRWNAAKIAQPQGRSRNGWTATGIKQLVSNPRLMGFVGHRVEQRGANGKVRYLPAVAVREGVGWPVVIERAQWEQLQARLEQRGAPGRVPRRRSLLTGLVFCAKCGSTMVRAGARTGDGSSFVRRVWRCMSGGGGHPSIDAIGLEALLVEATLQRTDTTALSTLVRAQGRQGKQANELMAELSELEQRTDAAAESFAAGRLATRAFEHANAEIERRKAALQLKLAPLTSTAALEPYAGRRGVLRATWPTLSVDHQRAIIAAALGPVKVSPGKPGRPSFDKDRVQIRKTR